MQKLKQWNLPYKQALPSLVFFQIVASVTTTLWLSLFSLICGALVRSTGRVAVTSGDFIFLFTTWQGYVIIILAILTLFFLVAMDINALVILCGRLVNGEKPNVLYCIKEGFVSLKRFFSLRGLLVVLYLSILAPILGFGVSISLTQNLYIPKFISSVIVSTPIYLIGVLVVFAALIILGFIYIFILHGTLLDDMKLKDSAHNSSALVRKNLKDFIKNIVVFAVLYALAIAAILAVMGIVFFIKALIPISESANLPVSVCLMLIFVTPLVFLLAMLTPHYVLKLTMLYERYMNGGEWEYQKRESRKSPLMITVVILAIVSIIAITSVVAVFGEEMFPNEVHTGYIAHRAGGNEAPENTVAGVEAAYKLGASGAEIDIQRTSDGYYVVNHDADFERTTGVAKKPSEMTLAEVKELKVDGEPVATFEEMLDASRGKLTLYVELKGETADKQMADDAVRIVKEFGMTDEAVLISLKYDLIDYIEDTYDGIKTGYLAFASFGDTASLNCDYLALEQQVANDKTIDAIHENNKKIFVWTVNDEEDLYDFLDSDADEIITDNVSGAKQVTEELLNRSLYQRGIDKITKWLLGSD